MEPLSPKSADRSLRWLASLTGATAVLVFAWEFLARQVPSSSWNLRGVPALLERMGIRAALLALAWTALAGEARTDEAPTRRTARVACAWTGSLLSFGSLAASARSGHLGTQITDASGLDGALLLGSVLGNAALVFSLAATLRARVDR